MDRLLMDKHPIGRLLIGRNLMDKLLVGRLLAGSS
jgi:hypothetical protein